MEKKDYSTAITALMIIIAIIGYLFTILYFGLK